MRPVLFALMVVTLAGCPRHRHHGPHISVAVMEKHGEGCDWVRRELPKADAKTLVTLPGPCDSAEAAWSVDRQRGLVALGTLAPGAQANATGRDNLDSDAYSWRLFAVTFATHAAEPLGTPPDGRLDDFGLDAHGTARALSFEKLAKEAKVATYRGQTFAVPDEDDGAAALAHSWSWDGKGWKLDESRVIAFDADGDLDGGFDWQNRLGPRTPNAYVEPDEDDPSWVSSPTLIARLDRAVGRTDAIAGSWRRVAVRPPLYNFVALGPGQTATLVKDDGTRATAEDQLSDPKQLLRLDVRRGYVLTTSAHHVMLRDRHGRVVFEGPAAMATFWPRPPKGFAAGLTR